MQVPQQKDAFLLTYIIPYFIGFFTYVRYIHTHAHERHTRTDCLTHISDRDSLRITLTITLRKEILVYKNPNKIVKVFGGRFVKGKFIKKDGTSRTFHGQLLTNTRTNKSLCFKDLAKKQIRSISMDSNHILISSGGLTYEVNAHG